MRNALDRLSVWFKSKGISNLEIPFFIQDVICFLDQEGYAPLNSINHELETLGWGIQPLDETVYQQLIVLHRNKNFVSITSPSSIEFNAMISEHWGIEKAAHLF